MKHIDAEMVLSIINANVKNVNLTMESLVHRKINN